MAAPNESIELYSIVARRVPRDSEDRSSVDRYCPMGQRRLVVVAVVVLRGNDVLFVSDDDPCKICIGHPGLP